MTYIRYNFLYTKGEIVVLAKKKWNALHIFIYRLIINDDKFMSYCRYEDLP